MYCFTNQTSNATIFAKYTFKEVPVIINVILFTINFIVLISAYLMLKKKFNVTYLLLGNLALTDLIPTLTFFSKLIKGFLESDTDCDCLIRVSLYTSAVNCSCFTVGLIALDKYFYLLHGMVYHKYATKRNVLIGLCIIWIINIAVGFLPVFGVHNDLPEDSPCIGLLVLTIEQTIARTILGLFPILVTVSLYLIVLRMVLKRINQMQSKSKNEVSSIPVGNSSISLRVFKGSTSTINSQETEPKKMKNKSHFKKFKILTVVALTCGSFLITWFPYYVCSLYYQMNCLNLEDDHCKSLLKNLPPILLKLASANSFLNPVIYLWWHKGFRKFIKKTFAKYCCNKGSSSNFESSKTTSSNYTVDSNN